MMFPPLTAAALAPANPASSAVEAQQCTVGNACTPVSSPFFFFFPNKSLYHGEIAALDAQLIQI